MQAVESGMLSKSGPSLPSVWYLVLAVRTRYHRLGGLDDKYLFLTVLEAGGMRSGRCHGQVLVRVCFLVCRWPSSFCVLTWPHINSPVSLLMRALIPSMGAPPS